MKLSQLDVMASASLDNVDMDETSWMAFHCREKFWGPQISKSESIRYGRLAKDVFAHAKSVLPVKKGEEPSY